MSEQATDTDLTTLGDDGAVGRTELIGLRKEYGDAVAVEKVNLEIEPGELLVLLGPSGCGKTTTLRMIAGLETPTAGTVLIDGEDETRTLPKNRDLSMVFQSYALYPHKTVRENLAFPLAKMDIDDRTVEQRIDETAALLEIEELLDKQPGQLSGGQRQRVAVGRTIVREPRLFLMDEPLSNLDAKLRVQTRSEIRDLQQRLGTTTVYVTHDQEEAMSIADRIAIMRDGHIEQVGPPREVYEQPVNEFIARFVGDPGINFLDCARRPAPLADVSIPQDAATAGLRPEDLTTVDAATDDRVVFDGRIEIVEPVGHGYEVTVDTGKRTVTALLDRFFDGGTTDETVRFAFDPTDLYWFDADGRRLSG
jgi:multiple sugar transport system ATP-binding protein